MSSSFSSTRLKEQAANDDADALDACLVPKAVDAEGSAGTDRPDAKPASDPGQVRLAERIAAIKPYVPIATATPVATTVMTAGIPLYRVTDAVSLTELMQKPASPIAVAPPQHVDQPPPDIYQTPAADSRASSHEAPEGTQSATPVVSEAVSFTTETRLANLLREQRELLERLARISGKAIVDANQAPERTACAPSDGRVAQARGPDEPATTAPAHPPAAMRTPDEIIKALAAVVDPDSAAPPAVGQSERSDEFDSRYISTRNAEPTLESEHFAAPKSPVTALTHAPEAMAMASLMDSERPPMIIERAYMTLPNLETDVEHPRAPGFMAGLALSGAAGLFVFLALRVG